MRERRGRRRASLRPNDASRRHVSPLRPVPAVLSKQQMKNNCSLSAGLSSAERRGNDWSFYSVCTNKKYAAFYTGSANVD